MGEEIQVFCEEKGSFQKSQDRLFDLVLIWLEVAEIGFKIGHQIEHFTIGGKEATKSSVAHPESIYPFGCPQMLMLSKQYPPSTISAPKSA